MGYSDLTTRSAGYKITATDWNALVNSANQTNSGSTSVGRTAVMATDTSTSNLASASWTLMSFASEEYDTRAAHSTSSNTSRLTVPNGESGLYQIHGMVTADYAATTKSFSLQVRKNAAGSSSGGTLIAQATTALSDNNYVISVATINTVVRLTASDYVELFVHQNTAGSLALKGTTLNHRFGMIWLTS